MTTEIYLQAPLGLHGNDALMQECIDIIKTGDVAAFLCHSPEFLPLLKDHDALDKTAFMLPVPFEANEHPALEGAHLFQAPDNMKAVRKMMGENALGVGPLSSKHDAMVLGEDGADYIAFPAAEIELIEWWVENFTLPCVAWGVQSLDDAQAIKKTGADFLCPAPWFWKDPKSNFESLLKILKA